MDMVTSQNHSSACARCDLQGTVEGQSKTWLWQLGRAGGPQGHVALSAQGSMHVFKSIKMKRFNLQTIGKAPVL